MIQYKWSQFKEKYSKNDITIKKMPLFFDFFEIKKDFLNVYEPAEDSFLICDILFLEKETLLKKENIKLTCEIGCGSGFVSCFFLSEVLLTEHYLIDCNKDALNLSKNLFKFYFKNCENFHFLENNLLKSINLKFDIIFFNPVINNLLIIFNFSHM